MLRPEEDIGDWAHPLVRSHPIAGTKALYGLCLEGGDMKAVEGLEEEEGKSLLRSLLSHAIATGEKYSHKWQLHDMLIWDNLRVHHQGRNDHPLGEPRLHHKFLLQTIKTGDDDSANAPKFGISGRRVPH